MYDRMVWCVSTDEKRAEMVGIECCHICSHIFLSESKTNMKIPEMNMEEVTKRNECKAYMVRTHGYGIEVRRNSKLLEPCRKTQPNQEIKFLR